MDAGVGVLGAGRRGVQWFASLTPAMPRRRADLRNLPVRRRIDRRLRPRRQRLGHFRRRLIAPGRLLGDHLLAGRRPMPSGTSGRISRIGLGWRTWCQMSFSATLPSWKGLWPASRK